MSARPSDQPPNSPRKFVPSVNPLESRLLLSRQVPFPDGTSFSFPTFVWLPRTGGALIQSGTALTVGVGQRTSNTVNIAQAGGGAAAVEWNGRPQHSITGVQAILVQAGNAAHDQIKINLTGSTAVAGTFSVPALSVFWTSNILAIVIGPCKRKIRTSALLPGKTSKVKGSLYIAPVIVESGPPGLMTVP